MKLPNGEVRANVYEHGATYNAAQLEAVVRDCAARCERRAQSLREGAAVARQCGQDILAGYGLEPE